MGKIPFEAKWGAQEFTGKRRAVHETIRTAETLYTLAIDVHIPVVAHGTKSNGWRARPQERILS
jgi:hypothetical protein